MENDIAVIGMGARLPDAPTTSAFWSNLVAGHCSVRDLSDEELAAAGVPARMLRDPRYVKAGVVLDAFDEFDADFFGLSPKEAAIMDPQHRQFLECAWEALEDSTHLPDRFGGPIGVFAGCGMGSYLSFNVLRNRQLMEEVGLFLLRHTGNDKDFLSTRVSYCFDLKGPSVNVQTACSTSLVAIHYACQSLLSGETDMTLAGGVTIEVPHGRGYMFHQGEILSPDGRCRAFDHRSRGTVFGSGAGVVVLRRLEDAIEDRDHIYAVIKGTAINNDGRDKVGYLAPSVDGQAAAIAEALTLADVDPADVGYVECHGTGTEIGDPIEFSALCQAFAAVSARQYCGIGSVKTNIGHLDTAAGVTSFMKACLALHHEQLPPTVNYEAPSPMIDFAGSPFFVNDKLRSWPRAGKPRYAGVQSLGVGGTNAHVVLGEAPAIVAPSPVATGTHLFVWSARNTRSLDDYAGKLAAHLRAEPSLDLADVASTLAHGRYAFARRRVAVVGSREEALRILEGGEPGRVHTHAVTESANVVFLLPGGGAQYRHMGKGLYETDAVFREHVDRGLELMSGQVDVDLREVWLGDTLSTAAAEAAFDRPSVQLPAIFICEYALAQSWQKRGVKPSALLGHSLGENTAACIAGVFSFADALRLVTLRGKLFERVERSGMLSVPLAEDDCRRRLPAELDLAVVNGPELCVVSGKESDLDAFEASLAIDDVEVQRVRIAIAAHSRLLDPILEEFGAFLRSMELKRPTLPFLSNRTGTWITDEQATDPEYWVQHLRGTVHFAEAVELLLGDSSNVFLEVGPGRALSSLARLHPKWSAERSSISSLRHHEEQIDDLDYFTCAHARLWASGVDVPLADVVPDGRARLSLPTYAFRHERYWVEADPEGASAPAAAPADRVEDVSKWLWEPVWSQLPPAAASSLTGTWLIFVDALGVASRVAERVRSAGGNVVEVHQGDAYSKLRPDRYSIAPELGREGYDALLADLAAHGHQLSGVVHAWLLTADRSFRPGSSFFHRCEEQGFFSLFFLAQALGAEEQTDGVRVVVLTNDTVGPGSVAVSPEKATVLGPCLVMPRELSGLSCALVDLQTPARPRSRRARADLDRVADAVLPELTSAEGGVLALRDEVRWRLDYEAAELPDVEGRVPKMLKEGGVYLVTGGLGGVGSLVAEWLARTVRARLVLVGRRRLPERSDWDGVLASAPESWSSRAIQKVRFLESIGAEVMLGAADVANVVEMSRVIEAARGRFGSIHGVFHAAGAVDDQLIANKEQATVERVMAPKVQGALVLDELLGDESIDFTVLFSSTSAVLGPPGQVDYVGANAFLNAMARRRCSEGKPTVALQWGVWNRVGMTAVDVESDDVASGRPEPVSEPLFDELVNVGGDEVVLTGVISCATHWLVDEHRTSAGHAVVPGTGYLEMLVEALAAIGEESPFEVRDLYFFQPMHVDDQHPRAVRARLRRSVEGYEVQIQGQDRGRRWQTHSQARLLLQSMEPAGDIDVAALELACSDRRQPQGREWIPSPQEAHLAFGPRWRVIRDLRYGDGVAVARIALPDDYVDEAEAFRLHPAALDLATGFAMELIGGYDDSRLWVPLAYRSVRVYGRLPADARSCVTKCERVDAAGDIYSFDLSICTPAGQVVVSVAGFQMKRLAPGQDFTPPSDDDASHAHEDRAAVGGSAAEQLLSENIQKGILPAEGMDALGRLLSGELPAVCAVTSVPLPGLIAELDAVQAQAQVAGDRFARPELDNDFVAPRDDLERALVRFWEDLLGIDSIGVRDDFFDLGGHSLIAVRLFAKIKKTFRVDYPMSVLFEAPTVEKCAELLRADGVAVADGEGAKVRVAPALTSRFQHLVSMHPSEHGDGTPFFLVAGMFGNVLNLRHLAQLAGADRPFYGLQARGLFGDIEPHASFDAAARDYIEELRSVQPCGPYLLGGFSGGGLAAYEMARQLRSQGQEVSRLVLLDTPLPWKGVVDRADRLKIQWQRLRRQGPVYIARWFKNRVAWEFGKLRDRFGAGEVVKEPATFHSKAVEAAFRAALVEYEVGSLDVPTWLFRPALDTTYDLGGGRYANKDRELVLPDNGWSQFLAELHVVETPGDHDGMVLEPNVRSLAALLREALDGI